MNEQDKASLAQNRTADEVQLDLIENSLQIQIEMVLAIYKKWR